MKGTVVIDTVLRHMASNFGIFGCFLNANSSIFGCLTIEKFGNFQHFPFDIWDFMIYFEGQVQSVI